MEVIDILVATVKAPLLTAKWLCHAPMAVWLAFGTAVAMSMDRLTYQVHTRDGSARKASSVARCSGSKRSQSPVWASRNVGTGDSADIPAPVNTTTERASATHLAAISISAIMCRAQAIRCVPCLEYKHRPPRIGE